MAEAPFFLYIALFLATLVAPLRWSIIAFLVLSNIDLGSLNASIGILNTAKAMVLPVILLWRFPCILRTPEDCRAAYNLGSAHSLRRHSLLLVAVSGICD